MSYERTPADSAARAAYVARVRSGPCFICGIVAGDPAYPYEQVFYDDGEHIAYLNRYPTVYGYVLVSPRRHVERVIGGMSAEEYLRLQAVVHRVATALESVVESERTYVLSLGSQQGNAHVHWHVVPLPPGTPYEEQQFHALMSEHGLIDWSVEQAAELAGRLRDALRPNPPIPTVPALINPSSAVRPRDT
jgi:histidine triad (HIT) family protein